MNSQAAHPKLLARDTIGIAYLLLASSGTVLLPTTARLAFESGSDTFAPLFMFEKLAPGR